MERAQALVIRGSDWSESSRIATLFTREFGKLRVLAKGGRRLHSPFEIALDTLTVSHIVFIRKATSGLELLTEAQVLRKFPLLRQSLPALYASYYVAELLAEGTQDYDPHPVLYDATLEVLEDLGAFPEQTAARLIAYELTWLAELGYSPALNGCAVCGSAQVGKRPLFSISAGGVVCSACMADQRERHRIGDAARQGLIALRDEANAWKSPLAPATRAEIRRLLGQYITYRLGRRLRTLPYVAG